MSLAEPPIPNPDAYLEEEREFNRYTLLGEFDPLFVALLKQRCFRDGIEDPAVLPLYFRAHINRGVTILQQRARNLSDIVNLVATANGNRELSRS
jgi:DNA sulfur modification protein DndE